ncbi:hypothetical protein [Paenibacillus agri]|uniref:Uncharacterized protein n=1 Tax=Paenibacillus agri TaxID=2744309 RepID=A0A850EQT9_9BACL|nr:hypothetical protein [Paenibacillus agri]NUU61897.1 hypothetical protein [Paenibacillus agri]
MPLVEDVASFSLFKRLVKEVVLFVTIKTTGEGGFEIGKKSESFHDTTG